MIKPTLTKCCLIIQNERKLMHTKPEERQINRGMHTKLRGGTKRSVTGKRKMNCLSIKPHSSLNSLVDLASSPPPFLSSNVNGM